MLGKTNIGTGGGGLVLKVVGGTTQPTSPTENTIWINTSTAIGSVTVAYNAPATPAEGDVWVKTGNDGNLRLNVSKHDTLIITPVSVKQYVSSAWVDVTDDSRAYTGGSWEPITFVYWQYGEAYADKFTFNAARIGVTSYDADSRIRFAKISDYNAAVYFGPIDVTHYSKMILHGGTTNGGSADTNNSFGITAQEEPSGANPEEDDIVSMTIPKSDPLTMASHELNITEASGSHYCYIKLRNYGGRNSVYVDKIEFE